MSTSPFFFFEDFKFDQAKILEFVENIPESQWLNPTAVKQQVEDVGIHIPHLQSDSPHAGEWWITTSKHTDFSSCSELQKTIDYFRQTGSPAFHSIVIKKSKKGYFQPFCALIQNPSVDKKMGVVRTFDIIIPVKGGFKESPLQARYQPTGEVFTLTPKGKAFMVSTAYDWHYSWLETVEDFRYTLHLRGVMPNTLEQMQKLYAH